MICSTARNIQWSLKMFRRYSQTAIMFPVTTVLKMLQFSCCGEKVLMAFGIVLKSIIIQEETATYKRLIQNMQTI